MVDCKVYHYKAQSEYNYPSQNLRLYDGHELCRIQVLSCEVSNEQPLENNRFLPYINLVMLQCFVAEVRWSFPENLQKGR